MFSLFTTNKYELRVPRQHHIERAQQNAVRQVIEVQKRGVRQDAKTAEAALRMVHGRFGDLRVSLEGAYQKVRTALDHEYATGVRNANTLLISIEQDIKLLETLGHDRKTSGIEYGQALERVRQLATKRSSI